MDRLQSSELKYISLLIAEVRHLLYVWVDIKSKINGKMMMAVYQL